MRKIDPDITEEPSPLCCSLTQEGLALKTYQSDIFNNWLKNEWVGETGSIADITKIDTSEGSFTIDTLNLAKKVYDLLKRDELKTIIRDYEVTREDIMDDLATLTAKEVEFWKHVEDKTEPALI